MQSAWDYVDEAQKDEPRLRWMLGEFEEVLASAAKYKDMYKVYQQDIARQQILWPNRNPRQFEAWQRAIDSVLPKKKR
jgi:hypothetical protein